MGAKSSLVLKFLQWFIRGIQFGCSAVVLAIFSYFLATLHNHQLDIPTWTRAVEGISGAGVLYSIVGLTLLCCLAGHPFTSFIAIVLDVAFIGAYVYVAIANKAGASSCTGTVDTPFGTGKADSQPNEGANGFTNLPTFKQACKMESACLAVSIVAIVFFIFSILVEVILVRHRRKEARFGPSPANNYTSGYGRKGGFFGRFKRSGTVKSENPNALPIHTTPDQVRPSYNTDTTRVGNDHELGTYSTTKFAHDGHTAYPEPAYGSVQGNTAQPGYRYGDGTY